MSFCGSSTSSAPRSGAIGHAGCGITKMCKGCCSAINKTMSIVGHYCSHYLRSESKDRPGLLRQTLQNICTQKQGDLWFQTADGGSNDDLRCLLSCWLLSSSLCMSCQCHILPDLHTLTWLVLSCESHVQEHMPMVQAEASEHDTDNTWPCQAQAASHS